jgi:hypothetical protein
MREIQETKNGQVISKKSKVGGLILLDFKPYCTITILKVVTDIIDQ